MAEKSKIQWTDHTFNPLIGCTKVSDGCKFCYAEELMDHRYHKAQWGPTGTRTRTAESNWRKVETWNRAGWMECGTCGWRGPVLGVIAGLTGFTCPQCCQVSVQPARQRVFCASLSDVFEDHPAWEPVRRDLLALIERTGNLDWLLLTKRPENVIRLIELAHQQAGAYPDATHWLAHNSHVWIGASIENQETLDKRLPALLTVPASVIFLSCEPLLSSLNFCFASDVCHCGDSMSDHCWNSGHSPVAMRGNYLLEGVGWVIAGCESGSHARPMDLAWVRGLRNQCQGARVPFFVKQLPGAHGHLLKEIDAFPADLRIREYPYLYQSHYAKELYA